MICVWRQKSYHGNQALFQIVLDTTDGGLCDIKLGGFGQETAYGGFDARFHYANNANGKILITVNMQSDYFDFGIKKVASEAKMYLITEPGLLDNFIHHLSSLENKNEKIELECVEK